MAQEPFPHLHFSYIGKLRAKFPSSFTPDSPEVAAIRENPAKHASTLRGVLEGLETDYQKNAERRKAAGLPVVKAGAGFVLRLKDGADADSIAHALNVELVAESEDGYILVATEDLSLSRLNDVLDRFEAEQDGGGSAASIMEIFRKPDDTTRIQRILTPEVREMWPFRTDEEYTFDLSIQTAPSLRTVKFQRAVQRKGETPEDFAKRKRAARDKVLETATDQWSQCADERFDELARFVTHFKGSLLSGYSNDPERPIDNGVRFADCIYVRVKMNGAGFQDVIYNLSHLFEVTLPEELKVPSGKVGQAGNGKPAINPPAKDAPAVCVIDSGIQENHVWLSAAMDSATSKCFLPNVDDKMVQDEVRDAGHGTRVAGAVLYPDSVPKAGEVNPIAWIQNARVLNKDNRVPQNLPPARYLTDVVRHFISTPFATKIYNHSIAAGSACPKFRMTAWASKMDELSAKFDVLFIQAAGNLEEIGATKNAPGIFDHRKGGKEYPDYLFDASTRIANPAQSMHALTVGAVPGAVFDGQDLKSFALDPHRPASYSRSGFGMWDAVKPDVVEVGGDYCHEKAKVGPSIPRAEIASELLCSTLHGAPAFAKDGVGTSFAAPKVAHVAAAIQSAFPNSSPLLYRALIVQSARWPEWAENEKNKDQVLRVIGFGKPDREKATKNSKTRITFVTENSVAIRNYDLHLYKIKLPEALRAISDETKIRLEITLSYTSEPRRTRRSRYGYLRTRVDWRCGGLGESIDDYRKRELGLATNQRRYPQPRWALHFMNQFGDAEETNRDRGTIQKDWAICEPHQLSSDFAIGVRAHPGWDHRKEEGLANYCLAVSFEAVGNEVPIYNMIAAEAQVKIEAQTEV